MGGQPAGGRGRLIRQNVVRNVEAAAGDEFIQQRDCPACDGRLLGGL